MSLLSLYLLHLGAAGFLGPDEPRYASIGRAMAHSGDWITPRLDGQPWFEKPPLLYWMTALGTIARLTDEWAARLPVALLSVAFLIFFYRIIAREFSTLVAIAATAILSTSAGWITYSFVAVTDLPMSATLAAAMFLALFNTRKKHGYAAGALLGASILAKAFVPLVLFAPVFLIARGKRLAIMAGCLAVAVPWHAWCFLRNGQAFWAEYFWRQQVGRFYSPERDHVQPFWFYAPLLLAWMFPWTPLMALLVRRKTYDDVRIRFLTAWLIYALVFFSASLNKLPGYVLPLLPALAILLANGLEQLPKASAGDRQQGAPWWRTAFLAACGLTLVAVPTVAGLLPDALLAGLSRARVTIALLPGLPFVAAAVAAGWLAWRSKPIAAILTVAVAASLGIVYLKFHTLPVLDQTYSVRAFWRANQNRIQGACTEDLQFVRRDLQYGLNYYAGKPLLECGAELPGQAIVTIESGRLSFRFH